jgi:hypothetical protein
VWFGAVSPLQWTSQRGPWIKFRWWIDPRALKQTNRREALAQSTSVDFTARAPDFNPGSPSKIEQEARDLFGRVPDHHMSGVLHLLHSMFWKARVSLL